MTGEDVSSAAEFNFEHSWIETQGIGALLAIGAGVKSGFEVTADTGLNVAISAGIAIASDTTRGAVLLQKSTSTTLLLGASDTWWVFATIEDSETNVSQTSGLPLFLAQDSDTLDGAVLLAKVITGVGSITSVEDLRNLDGAALDTAFTQDTASTTGLTFAYFGGIVQNGATVEVIADGDVALTDDATNYVEVDANGVVSANTTDWTAGSEALYEVVTASGAIVTVTALRPDLHLGSAPGITEATSTDGSVVITDPTGPTTDFALAADAATDTIIGDRTVDDTLATPASTGPLTSLLSWIAGRLKAITGEADWLTAPDITLADTKTHVDAAAPHSGHIAADGSIAMAADLDLGGFEAVNAATPTTAGSLVTKAYADGLLTATVPPLLAVKAATTANITLSGAQTIDSVSCIAGDRVGVINQTTSADNGIYDVAAGAWTRATDADTAAELPAGVAFTALNGAANEGKKFVLISTITTLGTDPQVWTQDGSGGGTGGMTSGSNTGTGASIFKSVSGAVGYFRKVKAGSSKVTVTEGTDDVAVDVVEANLTLNNIGGTLGATKGGTGLTSVAAGDEYYGSGVNVLSKLAGNLTATRKIKTMTSGVPAWVAQLLGSEVAVMGAAGPGHAPGVVGDPGATVYVTPRAWTDQGTFVFMSSLAAFYATSPTLATIPASVPTSVPFEIGYGFGFAPGMYVQAVRTGDDSEWVAGYVTSYETGTLTISVREYAGSGAHNDFVISLGGRGGAAGTDSNQSANLIKAGPASGAAAAPTYRSLVTDDLANGLVTYAKIQDVSATDKLLGRSTAGAGDVEEITCTAAGRALLDDANAAAQLVTLGAAAASHTHAASDIASGTVALARGGTNADLSATGGAVNTTGKQVLKQGSDNVIGAAALIAADLPNTAVTPGSYTSTNLTVDAQGRITAASNGSSGGAMTRIGQSVLGSPAASVSFNSIAGTYTDLMVTVIARGTTASTDIFFRMRFNSDSASNYDNQWSNISGTVSSPGEAFAVASIWVGRMPGSTAAAGIAGAAKIRIPNYAGTTYQKVLLSEFGSKLGTSTTNQKLNQLVGFWRNTAAITDITILPETNNFDTGTTITLWGIT